VRAVRPGMPVRRDHDGAGGNLIPAWRAVFHLR
jgi:hypothetical protein